MKQTTLATVLFTTLSFATPATLLSKATSPHTIKIFSEEDSKHHFVTVTDTGNQIFFSECFGSDSHCTPIGSSTGYQTFQIRRMISEENLKNSKGPSKKAFALTTLATIMGGIMAGGIALGFTTDPLQIPFYAIGAPAVAGAALVAGPILIGGFGVALGSIYVFTNPILAISSTLEAIRYIPQGIKFLGLGVFELAQLVATDYPGVAIASVVGAGISGYLTYSMLANKQNHFIQIMKHDPKKSDQITTQKPLKDIINSIARFLEKASELELSGDRVGVRL